MAALGHHNAHSRGRFWYHWTAASMCFFGNDRSLHSRVQTKLITKSVHYKWASDSFAYPCPCNNSWYTCASPWVKKWMPIRRIRLHITNVYWATAVRHWASKVGMPASPRLLRLQKNSSPEMSLSILFRTFSFLKMATLMSTEASFICWANLE